MKETHKTITVTCSRCGQSFQKRSDRAKKHKHNFCCRECCFSWLRLHPRMGKDNPAWKGGVTEETVRSWYRKAYRKAKAKDPEGFRLRSRNRMRKWRLTHPSGKQRRPSRSEAYWKEYRKVYMRSFRKKRSEETIARQAVGRMMRLACMVKKCKSTKYIGCSPGFLRNHIESLFKPGMTWDNWGEWEVDHVVPLSWFPFDKDPSLLFVASHWTNLQPLWSYENRKKHNLRTG